MVLEFLAKCLEQVIKVKRRHVVPDFETVVAHVSHQVARCFRNLFVDFVVGILLADVQHGLPGEHGNETVKDLAARCFVSDVNDLEVRVAFDEVQRET